MHARWISVCIATGTPVWIGLASVGLAPLAHAQGAEAPPSTARPDVLLPLRGLSADVGAGVVSHPKFLGAAQFITELAPVLEVQWGPDIHLSLDDGLSYTPLHFGAVSAGAVVEFRQSYAKARLARGPRAPDSTEAGVVVRFEAPFGEFDGRLRRSIDDPMTTSADLSFDTVLEVTEKVALGLDLRATWANDAFMIPGDKTRRTPNPPPVNTDEQYYTVGGLVSATYTIDPRWRVTALASYDRLLGGDSRKLNLATDNIPNVGLVVTRRYIAF